MRLAAIDHAQANIDRPEATCTIRHFIEHGVNWVDTVLLMSLQQWAVDIGNEDQ